MSLRSRLNKANQTTNAQTTTREPSKLFINLGITIDINGKDTFVNLPLTLTADRIADVIEQQAKSINNNSPTEWVELVEGRIALAEAVQAVFNKLPEGESVHLDEIDPDNPEFGFLRNLEVQFVHRKEKETVEHPEVRSGVLNKFRK